MKIHKVLLATAVILFSMNPKACFAELRTAGGQIAQPRIENGVALFVINPFGGSCGNRAYVDLSNAIGRAVYGTVLTAYTLGKVVTVRVDELAPRAFGECQLYDIVIN